jgi:hypothetical protein
MIERTADSYLKFNREADARRIDLSDDSVHVSEQRWLGASNPFRDEHCFHSCVGEIDLSDPAAQHEENINAPKSSRGSDTEKHQLTRKSFAPLGKNESAAHSGNQDSDRLSKPEVSLGSRDQLEGSTAKQRPEPGGQEI